MRSLHILVDQGNRKDVVQVEGVDNVSNHTNAYGQRCVLKICQLDIHRSKFYAPADVWILCRWIFESKGVPVGRLKVFKVRIAVNWWALQEPSSAHTGKVIIADVFS